MVVKARVVVVHPADQPGGEVRVGEQLLVDALRVIVVDAVDPQLRLLGELGDEVPQLGGGQVPVARAGNGGEGGSHRSASTRATGTIGGFCTAVASAAGAAGERPGARGIGGIAGQRRAERARGRVGEQLPVERARLLQQRGLDDGAVGPVQQLARPADRLREGADRERPVGGGVVEDERVVRASATGPPRAARRSACSGASPASIAKTIFSSGCSDASGVAGTPARPRACRRRSA